jgi:hypothetical protein
LALKTRADEALTGASARSVRAQRATMVYWPKAPNHSLFIDNAFKFVVGFGLVGGGVWKTWSMMGADHHDHEALQRSENAKELER